MAAGSGPKTVKLKKHIPSTVGAESSKLGLVTCGYPAMSHHAPAAWLTSLLCSGCWKPCAPFLGGCSEPTQLPNAIASTGCIKSRALEAVGESCGEAVVFGFVFFFTVLGAVSGFQTDLVDLGAVPPKVLF